MDRFEDAKLRVKEATDLVSLIESYLPLRPRGRLLLALCPFHQERSPSFTVYPDSQHFHCFGCGKSGDAFTFLMEREGLTFREAMESLADRASIPLDGVFGRSPEGRRGVDPSQVLGEVRSFFQRALFGDEGAAARDYLTSRGLGALLDSEAVDQWGVGFHPAPGALRAFAQQRRLPQDVLEEAGLLRNGREPFAGRVMFPIDDERGRVVAFGGRILPGAPRTRDGFEPPKYVNSPESPWFGKRRVLYGLWRAKKAGARRIVVMEGYTDVIACHLAGFPGAVAALGTAFTQEHAKKVERYASEGVVLLFDGDRAGEQAANRAMREVVNSRASIRIALLEGAKDPADFVSARAGEDADLVVERRARFADFVDGAEDALAVWFRLMRRRLDLSQPAQLEAAGRECAALLQLAEGDLRRQGLLQEMARHLAVPPTSLVRLLKSLRPTAAKTKDGEASDAGAAAAPTAPVAAPATPEARAEHELLAALLAMPQRVESLDGESIATPAIRTLVDLLREVVAQGAVKKADAVRQLFTRCTEQDELRQHLAVASTRADVIKDPVQFLDALERDRARRRGRSAARTLRQRLQQALDAGDRETADRLTHELMSELRAGRPQAPVEPAEPPTDSVP